MPSIFAGQQISIHQPDKTGTLSNWWKQSPGVREEGGTAPLGGWLYVTSHLEFLKRSKDIEGGAAPLEGTQRMGTPPPLRVQLGNHRSNLLESNLESLFHFEYNVEAFFSIICIRLGNARPTFLERNV